jgi:uncharacterized protein (TIGR02246 family)
MRTWIPTIVAVALVAGATFAISAADNDKPASGDEGALRAACAAYVDAVNKGDVDAVVSLWAEDADYVTDSGDRVEGHPALKKMFEGHLQTMKGKKLGFEIKSLRLIAPGVAIEDGLATVASDDPDETSTGTRYSAVWKRVGDKWLISSVRDLGDTGPAAKQASPLKGLQWLVGDWHSETDDVSVHLNGAMVLENSFLKQKFDVKPKEGDGFSIITMVGWDPTNQQIRSWYFDSRGGFGDGYWTQDGNAWTISSTGAIADGRYGTAANAWRFLDEDTLVWESKNRQLEGVPMPDSEVKFTRAGAAKVKHILPSEKQPD